MRDGRSFTTRQVVARQSAGAILNASVSFQVPEDHEADVTLAAKDREGLPYRAIIDEIDADAATCRTKADAPEIDGNLFIDEGHEALSVGDIVTVEVEEAGEYDLWGRVV